jgi:hypothetical protein
MSDIELVIVWSRRLEKLLTSRYGAQGRGLHSLTTSAGRRLPPNTERGLRWVATMRNRVLHNQGFRLKSRREFAQEARRLTRELETRGGFVRRLARFLLISGLFIAGIWGISAL